VLDKQHPLRFVHRGRAIESVLSRHASVRAAHGNRFTRVSDYWDSVADLVEVVDLRDIVPALRA
jgi:hypothetical protein